MAARFWTEERLKKARELIVCEKTSAECAAFFGVTVGAFRAAIYGKGITSRDRHAFNQSMRRKGRKESAETRAKKSEALKRRWADPESRARLEPGQRAAAKRADRQKSAETRRHCIVPEQDRAEYRRLQQSYGLSAREAGAAMGHPTNPQATGA